jgi:transketolase
MRNEFVAELCEIAAHDPRVVLLTGDLGFSILEQFAERFPDRFINCGVAEQNMTGVATGLAEAGFVPFTYSIATFAALRPYEFIRNGPALHRLPVRIVGVGGGFDYGLNGITHYALEDFAVMRAQPNVTVVAPADRDQARAALHATADLPTAVYFRVSKQGDPVPGLDGRFRLGRAERVGDARDVAIIGIGSAARSAVRAAELLQADGIGAGAAIVSSFNPDPVDDLVELLAGVPLAVTVEPHYRTGGLGSLVAEVIADHGLDCRLARAGVAAMPSGRSGTQAYLEDVHGLSPEQVVTTVKDVLAVRGSTA